MKLPETTTESRKLLKVIDMVLLNLTGATTGIYQGLTNIEKDIFENSFPALSSPKDNKEGLEKILTEFKQQIKAMFVLELSLAFEPKDQSIKMFGVWVNENINNNVLLAFKLKPEIIGGAVISFEGKYSDLSVGKKLKEVLKNG